MSASEFSEQIQSLLYGKLDVEFANPTYAEQLEIVRALTANPAAYSRLRIKGPTHPWISRLLETSGWSKEEAVSLHRAGPEARTALGFPVKGPVLSQGPPL
jgi:hypothetical protein